MQILDHVETFMYHTVIEPYMQLGYAGMVCPSGALGLLSEKHFKESSGSKLGATRENPIPKGVS